MTDDAIWILGATGRIGRAVAARLALRGLPVVLVGRDGERLAALSESLAQPSSYRVLGSLSDCATAIRKERPKVVLNTVGPFTHSALRIATACAPATHYVDLSNELPSVLDVLALDAKARSEGSVFVTGAGFGVLATESVVLALCGGRSGAVDVRCAAMPAVQNEPGRVGEALAATITGAFAFGGRHYRDGVLTRAPLFGDYRRVLLPDGRRLPTASGPTAELAAAHRASGAASVVSATSMTPSSPLLRAALPVLAVALKVDAIRRFANRRIASVTLKPGEPEMPLVSWAHARISWSSGRPNEGWLRTGDAMEFTSAVAAEVAARLAWGEGKPGAYTPGALFGSKIAEDCGAEIIVA